VWVELEHATFSQLTRHIRQLNNAIFDDMDRLRQLRGLYDYLRREMEGTMDDEPIGPVLVSLAKKEEAA